MTIGRLNSAASSVAVPLAISVTSQAASASCDWPSSRSIGTSGACSCEHRRQRCAQPEDHRQHEAQVRPTPAAAAPRPAGTAARCSWTSPSAAAGQHRDHRFALAQAQRAPGLGPVAPAAGSRRPADGRRRWRRCRARRSSSGSNGNRHSTWSTPRAMRLTRPPRQAQIDGQTKWIGARCRCACSRASRSRLKSGASTPMKTSGRCCSRRSASCVADAADLAVSGAAPRRSRARPACACGHQASKPCCAICGPPMPTARRPGQRSRRPPSSSAGEQVARGFAGHHRPGAARDVHQRLSARCRAAALARNSSISATSAADCGLRFAPARRSAAWPASRVRLAAVQQPVHLLDDVDALGAEAAPPQAFGIDALGLGRVARRRHERRQVLRQARLETDHGVRADAHELVHARTCRRPSPSRPAAHGRPAGVRLAMMVWLPTWQSCAMCT